MEKYFGFRLQDLSSLSSLTRLLNRPCDPSSLAVARIFFGILMILDIPEERGLSQVDHRWGNSLECRFPLFDCLSPLPLEGMCMVYLLMLLGAAGMTLGAFYKTSCLCFLLPYWYIFLLDKTRWNNHSYLYGWLGFLLFLSDADRCWSVDGWWNKNKQHTDVPLWNYSLLRGQIFVVYFIAGLKKLDRDWMEGYSMQYLSTHWLFDAFRNVITEEQIDQYLVHWGGFLLDFTAGFLLFFNESRAVGFVFCIMFHLMNSQLFYIGMFPYMMIATTPLFCSCDWPKIFIKNFPKRLQDVILYPNPPAPNTNCIYLSINKKKEKTIEERSKKGTSNFRYKMAVFGVCAHFVVQGFLPYSHWLTKGYNTWTQGLYGYSWDMMVHNWKFVHSKITMVDRQRNAEMYVDPEAWCDSGRWPKQADMVKQFASCVQQHVRHLYNITDIEIYIDVWMSLNGRFAQRIYDPTVNILEAEWSPLQEITWVLPLLTELSDWRSKLDEVETSILNESEFMDVLFVADFPGFHLINYIEDDLSNTTLQVLKGTVSVQFPNGTEKKMEENDVIEVPSGSFHKVFPLKHSPACYMYVYTNTTLMKLNKEWNEYESFSLNYTDTKSCDRRRQDYFRHKREEMNYVPPSFMNVYWELLMGKYLAWRRSFELLSSSVYHIFTNTPMSKAIHQSNK